jgi:TonB family protein
LAVGIPFGAVALAGLHPRREVFDFTVPHDIVGFELQTPEPQTLEPPDLSELPLPPLPSGTPDFIDSSPPAPRRDTTKPKRIQRAQVSAAGPRLFRSISTVALNAPRPSYPYEARRQGITGTGIAIMTVDPATGRVVSVTMSPSTGSEILDSAIVAGLRRWRFQPGTVSTVRCPITYTLSSGAVF